MKQIMGTDKTVTMNSLEIAELTGKSHGNVMRDIRNMFEELEKDAITFESIYKDAYDRDKPCYKLDKLHTETLILGYSAKLRMKVLERLAELEQTNMPQLPNFSNPAEAARAWADEVEAKQAAVALIEQQKPAVEFVKKYVEADSLKGFREVCKLLNANEREFRQFLVEQKIVYRLGGAWTAYKPHIEAGRMDTKAATANGKTFNQIMFTAKGVTWIAEKWAKYSLKGGENV